MFWIGRLATPLSLALGVSVIGVAVALAGTPIDETIPARPDSEIKIENLAGSVTVTVGRDDQVHVSGTLGENAKRLAIKTDDEDIDIEVVLPRQVEDIAGTDLVIEVPRGAEVFVETVSANVAIEGVEGKVGVETVSGTVGVDVPAANRRVRLESVSGEMTIVGTVTDLRAESVSGKIDVDGVSGEIEVSTTSGVIEVAGDDLRDVELGSVTGSITLEGDPKGRAEVEIENLSGSVAVYFSEAADAEIRVETFTGAIDSDFEASLVSEAHGKGEWLRTVVGAGSATVKISTFSGPVQIKKR